MKTMTNTSNKQANKEMLRQRKSVCNHEQQKVSLMRWKEGALKKLLLGRFPRGLRSSRNIHLLKRR